MLAGSRVYRESWVEVRGANDGDHCVAGWAALCRVRWTTRRGLAAGIDHAKEAARTRSSSDVNLEMSFVATD
jgi:hypothetical protein